MRHCLNRRITALLAAAALVAAIAGCGGDGGGDDNGPTAVVPEDAAGYFEIAIRPQGDARSGAEDALGKVLDTDDPGARIVSQLEKSAAADGQDLSWSQDIAPWLGETVGSFPSSLAGDADAVVIAETTDPDKALEFVRSQEDATGQKQEYKGVEYELDAGGDAFGIVDDFLVFGRPEGFQQAVDASQGASLAESDTFKDAVGDLPDDRLGTLYAIPKDFLEAIPADEIDPAGRSYLLKVIGDASEEPVLGDLTASADGVTLELSAGGGDVETGQSALLPDLPADSWLALGLADIGSAVQNGLDSVESADIPGFDAAAIRRQLQSSSGIDLDQDVIDTLGDAAVFVTGTSEKNLSGALVIESKDPAASAGLLTKLQGLIRSQGDPKQVKVQPLASADGDTGFQLVDPTGELPQPVQVVQRGDRIVAGYGDASINQALSDTGANGLASNPAFQSAQDQVGDLGVDAFLSFAPVFQLAEASGANSDPGYQQAKPYIDGLDFLALGSGTKDDRAFLEFVVGLK